MRRELAVLLAGLAAASSTVADSARGAPPAHRLRPVVARDLHHDLSPPLFLLRPKGPDEGIGTVHEPYPLRKARGNAPAAAPEAGELLPDSGGSMPAPLLSFDGVANLNNVAPPDTNGDVGPNHY